MLPVQSMEFGQPVGDDFTVIEGCVTVDLGAIAGGYDDRFVNRRNVLQFAQRMAHLLGRESDFFAYLERCCQVIDAERQ